MLFDGGKGAVYKPACPPSQASLEHPRACKPRPYHHLRSPVKRLKSITAPPRAVVTFVLHYTRKKAYRDEYSEPIESNIEGQVRSRKAIRPKEPCVIAIPGPNCIIMLLAYAHPVYLGGRATKEAKMECGGIKTQL